MKAECFAEEQIRVGKTAPYEASESSSPGINLQCVN